MIGSYLLLFGSAFLAATILPFYSEVVLFALLRAGGDPLMLVTVAAVGNTLGAVVNWATTLATATRVLRQLRRDRRTLVLLIGVPSLLLVLVRYSFDARPEVFQRVGLPLIGVFPLVSMFLVASVLLADFVLPTS